MDLCKDEMKKDWIEAANFYKLKISEQKSPRSIVTYQERLGLCILY